MDDMYNFPLAGRCKYISSYLNTCLPIQNHIMKYTMKSLYDVTYEISTIICIEIIYDFTLHMIS